MLRDLIRNRPPIPESYTFQLWGSPHNPEPEFRGWWLVVDDRATLEVVYLWKCGFAADTYFSLRHCKDDNIYRFEEQLDFSEGGVHSDKRDIIAGLLLGRACREKKEKGYGTRLNLAECCQILEEGFAGTMVDLFNHYGTVLVNPAGGCCPADGMEYTWTLLDTKTSTDLIFPDKEDPQKATFRIFKWTQGKHWYAKTGDIDIVVDGKQCWKTRQAARAAVKEYADKNGMVFEEE